MGRSVGRFEQIITCLYGMGGSVGRFEQIITCLYGMGGSVGRNWADYYLSVWNGW